MDNVPRYLKKISFALVLVLLALPAWAVSPSYSGGGSSEGAGHFLGSSIIGAGAAFNVSAGELITVPVFTEVISGGPAPTVIGVSNDVTPLQWRKRAIRAATISSSGGFNNCIGNFTVWEAFSPGAITGTHVSVTISGPADGTIWWINRYVNAWGAARAFDGNTSVPVTAAVNTGGAAPTATIPATTQSNDLAVGYTAYCSPELANVAGAGFTANNSYATTDSSNYISGGSISKSVSAPQTNLAVPFGNTLTSSAGYFIVADALTNDPPPAKLVATSAPVSTAITITSSGGGCGTVPAGAVAAGWSTCVINNDFSLPFYATQSNWIDCAGATTPQWYKGWNAFPDSSGIPCNFATQQTDPASGLPALQLHSQDSYFTGHVLQQAPLATVSTAGVGLQIPNNAYFEVTARSALGGTPPPGAGWKWDDYWSYSIGGSGAEWDGIEINLNDHGGLISGAGYHNFTNGNSATIWGGNPVDYSTYHKYAWRVTSNGTSDGFMCSYLDDAPYPAPGSNCISWAPNSGQVSGIGPQTLQLFIGCYSTPPGCGNHDLYVSRVRVFSCAAANSGATCVTSSANP